MGAARRETVIEGTQAMPPPLPPQSYTPPPPPYSYGSPPPQQLPYGSPQSPAPAYPAPAYGPPAQQQVPYGGQQPYGNMYGGAGYPGPAYGMAQGDLDKRASSARTCGLISLLTIISTNIFSFIVASSGSEELVRFYISIRTVFGLIAIGVLVLAIMAVAKSGGVKRVLNQFPADPRVRSKATAGQVMGWITLGIFALGIIVFAANRGRGLG